MILAGTSGRGNSGRLSTRRWNSTSGSPRKEARDAAPAWGPSNELTRAWRLGTMTGEGQPIRRGGWPVEIRERPQTGSSPAASGRGGEVLRLGRIECRTCQTLSRRSFLRIGALGPLGLSLADYLAVRAAEPAPAGRARAVILLWLWGGPSQLDT